MQSSVPGTRRTLTVTTWSTISDIDFQDIGLNSLRSGTRLGDLGNNSNITFITRNVYWNLAGSQSYTAAGWATTSGGTPALDNFPLPQDTVIFNNSGAAGTVTFGGTYYFGTLEATKTTAYTLTGQVGLVGNVFLSGSVTFSTGSLLFVGRSAQTVTTNGIAINGFTPSGFGNTVTLLGALTCNSVIVASPLNTGNFSVTCGTCRLESSTSDLQMGSSTLTVTDSGNSFIRTLGTITGTGTINMTSASAKTFAGGGVSISGITLNQGGAGALTITGANTFGNISNTYGATGATTLTMGGNQTVANFTAEGAIGNVLTLNSNSVGVQRTLTKSGGGTVTVSYLDIKDSNAVGATWTALVSSDSGNNTGWNFGFAGGGNFMAFFM